jgi:hypothetical protein
VSLLCCWDLADAVISQLLLQVNNDVDTVLFLLRIACDFGAAVAVRQL